MGLDLAVKQNEDVLVRKFVDHFSEWFDIEREVRDDNRIGRIDLILQCKVSEAIFGIECKAPGNRPGTDVADIILQAIQYSRLQFHGKRIPIFLVPSISHNQLACVFERQVFDTKEWVLDKHDQAHRHHTVNGILGKFNIGEVRKIRYGEKFFHDFTFSNQVIYTTKFKWLQNDIEGLQKENYTNLTRKILEWETSSRIFKTSR